MLIEFARMSAEDGLVMQLHIGSLRNHNAAIFGRFGPDMGADIPIVTEWTHNLQALLNEYGADPRFRLILFTLDKSSYSRELAPLAGHYPAVLLGPPWWFYDSVNGMRRYFDLVIETAVPLRLFHMLPRLGETEERPLRHRRQRVRRCPAQQPGDRAAHGDRRAL